MPEIDILEPLTDEMPSIIDLIDNINTLSVKSLNHTNETERENACREIFNLTCKITAEFQNMCREELSSSLCQSLKIIKKLPNNSENTEILRQIRERNHPKDEY